LNILVTGGAGFIGSNIVDKYIDEGHNVFVIDNLSTGFQNNVNKKAKLYVLDLYKDSIKKVLKKNNIEVINHHAAQIDVRKSVEDPKFDAQVNIEGSLNLFQAAINNGVKKIIFASTGGAIYGEQETFPADENHPTKPLSPYAISKLAVEKYLYFYKKSYGINYVILRYANVYGPRQNPLGEAGVVSIFCENILQNKKPIINGDGMQTRDYVFVEDVVNANVSALDLKTSETVNIGTSVETDVNYLFDFINKYFGSKYKEVHGEPKAGEQLRSVISCEKAMDILNWRPQNNINEGLEKTCKWFENNLLYANK